MNTFSRDVRQEIPHLLHTGNETGFHQKNAGVWCHILPIFIVHIQLVAVQFLK
jgi:hypothetical protein